MKDYTVVSYSENGEFKERSFKKLDDAIAYQEKLVFYYGLDAEVK